MFTSNSRSNDWLEVWEVTELLFLKILKNDWTGLEECFLASLFLVEDCTSCNNCWSVYSKVKSLDLLSKIPI